MSKNSGMGSKRIGARLNKGMDKCDVSSHGKQCGRIRQITKGGKMHIIKKRVIILPDEMEMFEE